MILDVMLVLRPPISGGGEVTLLSPFAGADLGDVLLSAGSEGASTFAAASLDITGSTTVPSCISFTPANMLTLPLIASTADASWAFSCCNDLMLDNISCNMLESEPALPFTCAMLGCVSRSRKVY